MLNCSLTQVLSSTALVEVLTTNVPMGRLRNKMKKTEMFSVWKTFHNYNNIIIIISTVMLINWHFHLPPSLSFSSLSSMTDDGMEMVDIFLLAV